MIAPRITTMQRRTRAGSSARLLDAEAAWRFRSLHPIRCSSDQVLIRSGTGPVSQRPTNTPGAKRKCVDRGAKSAMLSDQVPRVRQVPQVPAIPNNDRGTSDAAGRLFSDDGGPDSPDKGALTDIERIVAGLHDASIDPLDRLRLLESIFAGISGRHQRDLGGRCRRHT